MEVTYKGTYQHAHGKMQRRTQHVPNNKVDICVELSNVLLYMYDVEETQHHMTQCVSVKTIIVAATASIQQMNTTLPPDLHNTTNNFYRSIAVCTRKVPPRIPKENETYNISQVVEEHGDRRTRDAHLHSSDSCSDSLDSHRINRQDSIYLSATHVYHGYASQGLQQSV